MQIAVKNFPRMEFFIFLLRGLVIDHKFEIISYQVALLTFRGESSYFLSGIFLLMKCALYSRRNCISWQLADFWHQGDDVLRIYDW